MKKFLRSLVFVLVAVLLTATVAFAVTVNRSPDATFLATPAQNQASYWGEGCTKVEAPFVDPDGSVVTLGNPHTLIVLKSARSNFVWYDTTPGKYGTPTEQDVSHFIYCDAEIYEPCDETVAGDVVYGDWVAVGEPMWNDWQDNGDGTFFRTGSQLYERTWSQTFYDAYDPDYVCGGEKGIQKRGLLMRETEEGLSRTVPFLDCNGASACEYFYDPDGFYTGEYCEHATWVIENETENATLLDIYFEEPYDCDAPCIGMYYLPGERYYDYPCYLNRNPLTDSHLNIPERYMQDGVITDYAQGECNQLWTCEGWTTGQFNHDGTWQFVCEYVECLDCEE